MSAAARGPLTFTDPKSMLTECVAGTGIAQIIGWGIGEMLKRGDLIDLFPKWHGERFHSSRFTLRANIYLRRSAHLRSSVSRLRTRYNDAGLGPMIALGLDLLQCEGVRQQRNVCFRNNHLVPITT